jgi:hypothetical protein
MNEMSALIIFALEHRVGSVVENENMVPEKTRPSGIKLCVDPVVGKGRLRSAP